MEMDGGNGDKQVKHDTHIHGIIVIENKTGSMDGWSG